MQRLNSAKELSRILLAFKDRKYTEKLASVLENLIAKKKNLEENFEINISVHCLDAFEKCLRFKHKILLIEQSLDGVGAIETYNFLCAAYASVEKKAISPPPVCFFCEKHELGKFNDWQNDARVIGVFSGKYDLEIIAEKVLSFL